MRDPQPCRAGRRRFAGVTELLAGATERTVVADVPGKSGARLEHVVIGGQRYVLKHLDLAEDWTMRASGCLPGAPLVLWERGILARLPDCFNQPIVGVAREAAGTAAPAGSGGPWCCRPRSGGPGSLGRLRAADARRHAVAGPGRRRADQRSASTSASFGTWPPCTRRSGAAGRGSTWCRPCTATWSFPRGRRRRRRRLARRTWYRSWSRRAGRCWRRWRRPPQRWSLRWPTTRARWWTPWPRRRTRSCTATGSWTTWAPTTQGGRSCWTGNSRAAAHR